MLMNSSGKYDFRQFQDELARLDREQGERKEVVAPAPAVEKRKRGRPRIIRMDPLAEARLAFEALRLQYDLHVADVVAWFPEEEGVAYLQSLLATPVPKRRRKKPSEPEA